MIKRGTLEENKHRKGEAKLTVVKISPFVVTQEEEEEKEEESHTMKAMSIFRD